MGVTNLVKASSVDNQPALTVFAMDYQLNLHITKQKDLDDWYNNLVSSRKFALQKKQMADKTSLKPVAKRDRWYTLKRRRGPPTVSGGVPMAKTPGEIVVANPLHGMSRDTLSRRLNLPHLADDQMKKSTSLNSLEHPQKRKMRPIPTGGSESGDNIRSIMESKKGLLARSTSISSFGKTPNSLTCTPKNSLSGYVHVYISMNSPLKMIKRQF